MNTGSTSGPLHAALAQSDVLRARVGSGSLPLSVIAAAREERSLRRLRRRIRLWSRLGLIH
jgi:hypothetical protein